MKTFTPLRVRSHGSLLNGTASPEALVERAAALGCEALALTDRDNLYLAIRFWKAARAAGLAPLLGAELTHGPHGVLLLPVDRRGYAHLCALLSRRHLDPAFDLVASLAELHRGLHLIVESPGLAGSLLAAGVPPATGDEHECTTGARGARRHTRHLGGLWMGVRGLPAERAVLRERWIAGRRLGVPLVATGDCVLLDPKDHEVHKVAVTAAAGELLERMPPAAFCAREAWACSPGEWERRVRAACGAARVPEAADEALANNRALAGRCRLELELGVPIFPRAPLPAGVSGPAHLLALGRAGVERRYRATERPPALARLERELGEIQHMGFTDYFLLVAEIVEFARARGIPTVGRGSGAGSIVSYVLGITNVDPLRYGLYFERFLNSTRRDCPDLDIDLCWKRRDEVIEHVYRTYGDDRVAMISTHATLGARSAFRETAKALGVSNARVNALAKRVPREMDAPYLEKLEAAPEGRSIRWREPPLAEALRLAERLDGAPRHLSIHCGGVVIGDRALTHYLPLERAAKGVVVSQFEMRAIEAIGLVKMDLLGNRALSTIGECVELVAARGGERIEPDAIPDEDALTGGTMAAGDTLNCFQLESPAMRHLLRMLDARTLDQTIAAVALVRPGPAESGMKEAYCRRERGLEPVRFLHPRLEPVLRDTHGVMLYEEDVMRVAAAIAGIPLHEGEALRRAIGAAREDEEFRTLERGFVAQCGRVGVDAETACAVWRDLTRFASYAFCKAHAAGYGRLGWQSAWLRDRFPTEWAVGILNHHAGMYPTWVHVEDLRRRGVEFLAPCAQRSAWESTLESDGPGERARIGGSRDERVPGMAERGAGERGSGKMARPSVRRFEPSPPARHPVRVGLGRVFGLAHETGARIVAARAGRPFASLADFTDRARPTLPELESLILAGALDWTGRTRPSLLLEARVSAARAPAGGRRHAAEPAPALAANGASALPEATPPVAVPDLPEFDLAERVRGETRATGLWFSGHPLELFADPAALAGASPAASLAEHLGRRLAVAGLPCAYRRVETKSGGQMLFLTLADRSGLVECVLFPDAYRAHAAAVRGEVVRAEGRVDETLGSVTLTLERAEAVVG